MSLPTAKDESMTIGLIIAVITIRGSEVELFEVSRSLCVAAMNSGMKKSEAINLYLFRGMRCLRRGSDLTRVATGRVKRVWFRDKLAALGLEKPILRAAEDPFEQGALAKASDSRRFGLPVRSLSQANEVIL
jgi:hypothetical protein